MYKNCGTCHLHVIYVSFGKYCFFGTVYLASMISTVYRRNVIHRTLLERL